MDCIIFNILINTCPTQLYFEVRLEMLTLLPFTYNLKLYRFGGESLTLLHYYGGHNEMYSPLLYTTQEGYTLLQQCADHKPLMY